MLQLPTPSFFIVVAGQRRFINASKKGVYSRLRRRVRTDDPERGNLIPKPNPESQSHSDRDALCITFLRCERMLCRAVKVLLASLELEVIITRGIHPETAVAIFSSTMASFPASPYGRT